eukprot:scaffold1046_cov162-Ochromonas_danica.AAC.7
MSLDATKQESPQTTTASSWVSQYLLKLTKLRDELASNSFIAATKHIFLLSMFISLIQLFGATASGLGDVVAIQHPTSQREGQQGRRTNL